MKKIIASILLLSTACWAVDAYYRHHQRSTTSSLEANLVNREIGIDASSRNCIVGKKADGTTFHGICKEMDTATLSGVLNLTGAANLATLAGSGTRIVTSTAAGQLGNATTATGTNVTLSGTLNADTIVSSKFYTEGTFTITGTGFSGTVTGTARYIRIGKSVTLYLPQLQGTSNATTFTMTGMPAAIRPARIQWVLITGIVDNSAATEYHGSLNIATDGTIDVYRKTSINGPETNSYTNSGTKGIYTFTVHYSMQ